MTNPIGELGGAESNAATAGAATVDQESTTGPELAAGIVERLVDGSRGGIETPRELRSRDTVDRYGNQNLALMRVNSSAIRPRW